MKNMNSLNLHNVVDIIVKKRQHRDIMLPFDVTETTVIDKNGNKFTITCFMEEKDENTN